MKNTIFILILLTSLISFSQEISNEKLDYIKTETIGGKLDFALKMKNDKKSLYLYDRVAYNRKDFGIFLWGNAVKKIGISSRKKAIKLWEEIKKRKLSKPEKKSLIRGFKTKIE